MNATKTCVILHGIVTVTFIVCITIAAIYSNKYGLLWWYLIPAVFGSVSVSSDEKSRENNKTEEPSSVSSFGDGMKHF